MNTNTLSKHVGRRVPFVAIGLLAAGLTYALRGWLLVEVVLWLALVFSGALSTKQRSARLLAWTLAAGMTAGLALVAITRN